MEASLVYDNFSLLTHCGFLFFLATLPHIFKDSFFILLASYFQYKQDQRFPTTDW
jgi:hypothetical protein